MKTRLFKAKAKAGAEFLTGAPPVVRSHPPTFPLTHPLPALLAMILIPTHASAAEFFLRAAAVTNTMPDGAQVVQWGFARDTAFGARNGAVTVPGPVLVVPPNDPVLTIRLDNDLPEPISIVINGQFSTNAAAAPVRHPDGRVRSFTQETPPGNLSPVTYSWSGVRAGTYLYVSGSHPQVQIPMGLYGAMKKDTNNGVAYPGASYASDVVLLFSEIDPVLNDAVATGNFGAGKARPSVLGYEAKYFLINGVPYTNGAPAIRGGDPGRTNLIRFLNASLETHVPILDGTYLRLVAEDGNLRPYAQNSYAVHLPPQKTIDALLVNPPAGTYALYDRRLGLVSGANVPGGMLAYLSYNLSAPVITSQPLNQTVGQGDSAVFMVTAVGTAPLSYQWQGNSVNLVNGGGISGATTPTLLLSNVQPAQAGTYSVKVTNTLGSTPSSDAVLTVFTLPEAVDATALTWTTGGNAPWIPRSLITHDGIDAAQGGAIANSQESWLQTIVVGPGTLTFWWKVSSELNNDLLRLYRNGTALTGLSISGEVNWEFRSVAVPAGTQTFRWRYNKNGSTAGGQDRVWLDQVQFSGPATPDTTAPAAVLNLAVTSLTSSSATLAWTSPGDDGNSGTATSYDVRYSTAPITAGNFAAATQVNGEPAPVAAGALQGMTVGGLTSSTLYYFALKTSDEATNVSALSNVPNGTTAAPPSGPNPTNVVPLNSIWKYLADGSDQGAAWSIPSYNDAPWPSGPAELGYGDGGEATVVGSLSKNFITTYFRHSFTIANPAAYASLTVRLLRDDGGVVYLNGVEVFRSNMPSGAINYLTLSSGPGDEVNYFSNPVSPALLVSGVNVIAVEIHQKQAGSSDLSFNLQLIGTLAP